MSVEVRHTCDGCGQTLDTSGPRIDIHEYHPSHPQQNLHQDQNCIAQWLVKFAQRKSGTVRQPAYGPGSVTDGSVYETIRVFDEPGGKLVYEGLNRRHRRDTVSLERRKGDPV